MTPPASRRAAAGEPNDDEIGYVPALAELESILAELEGDAVDVDRLAERVARAAVLIRLCRARISAARFEIESVVAGLDDLRPAGEAEGDAGPSGRRQ